MIIIKNYLSRALSICKAPKERFLATFDFDKTIITEDSYVAVAQLLTPEQRKEQLKTLVYPPNWIIFIRNVLQLLHEQHGLNATRIGQYVRRLPAIPGMIRLMRSVAAQPNMDMCILSDSNRFFIKEWLWAHGLDDMFDNIYTNPTSVLSNGQLLVNPYEHQTHCDQCPYNLCKGEVMKKLLQCDDVNYKRVIYFGDSCNDLCAIRCLRADDLACIRRGYELHDKLPAHRHELSCMILYWRDGHELQDKLIARNIL